MAGSNNIQLDVWKESRALECFSLGPIFHVTKRKLNRCLMKACHLFKFDGNQQFRRL